MMAYGITSERCGWSGSGEGVNGEQFGVGQRWWSGVVVMTAGCDPGSAGAALRVVGDAVVVIAAVSGHPAAGELASLVPGDDQLGEVGGR
jgi:hypothetical protein